MKKQPQTTTSNVLAISSFVKNPARFSITNSVSMENAVTILSQLNKGLDKLTSDEEKMTKPMNEALKEIRSRYKPKKQELEAAIKHVRRQMTEYQTNETERLSLIAENIANEIGESMTFEEASTEIGALRKPDSQVRTEDGMVSFRTVTRYEVEDISKVPMEYHEIDMTKIKNELPNKVPGIKYWTEQQPINRR